MLYKICLNSLLILLCILSYNCYLSYISLYYIKYKHAIIYIATSKYYQILRFIRHD